MAIIRWSPVNEVSSLTNAINRLFAESFPMSGEGSLLPGTRSLAVNMKETKDSIIVEAAMPGMSADDVELHVDDNVLTIKGETRQEEENEEEGYLCRECYTGSFYRQVGLPASVQADKAEATSHNGMLTVTIPKAPEAKPKRIEIKSKDVK